MSAKLSAPLRKKFKKVIDSGDKTSVLNLVDAVLAHSAEHPEAWEDTQKREIFFDLFNANGSTQKDIYKKEVFNRLTQQWSPSPKILGSLFSCMQFEPLNLDLLINYGVRQEHVEEKASYWSLLGGSLSRNLSKEMIQNLSLYSKNLFWEHDGEAAKEFFRCFVLTTSDWEKPDFKENLMSLPTAFNFPVDKKSIVQEKCHDFLVNDFFRFFPRLVPGTRDVFQILRDLEFIDPSSLIEQMIKKGQLHEVHLKVVEVIYEFEELGKITPNPGKKRQPRRI